MAKKSVKKTVKKAARDVKNHEYTTQEKVGIGVGLTAAAVAAAGAYFLYGSEDAPKNRKKIKGWALKAKGDVLDALEKAEQMTEEEFKDVVERVANTYDKARTLGETELNSFRREMAKDWRNLVASGVVKVISSEQVAKKAATTTKKVAKKAAKKVAKKTPKKTTKKTTKKST